MEFWTFKYWNNESYFQHATNAASYHARTSARCLFGMCFQLENVIFKCLHICDTLLYCTISCQMLKWDSAVFTFKEITESYVIIYSPSYCPKPVLFLWNTKADVFEDSCTVLLIQQVYSDHHWPGYYFISFLTGMKRRLWAAEVKCIQRIVLLFSNILLVQLMFNLHLNKSFEKVFMTAIIWMFIFQKTSLDYK